MYRLILLIFLSYTFNAFAQNAWIKTPERGREFIENKGQFDAYASAETGKVLYAIDEGNTKVLFGEHGIGYYFLNAEKVPKAEREERKRIINTSSTIDKDAWQRVCGKYLFQSDRVSMQWLNSSVMSVSAAEKLEAYHSYAYTQDGKIQNQNHIAAYKKITYHNLYPAIDVEISIHEHGGFKYNYILHSGASINVIKTRYTRSVTLKNGAIHIPTSFGDIIEHNPVAYYEYADSQSLPVSFSVENGNIVSFTSSAISTSSQTVIIDPWVQTPNFNTTWKCVWECERDAAGNVYIIGGIMPMQVLKYNSGGTLQWTYNTPYDTSNAWLGTFATDDAGNCYITAGSAAKIQKINAAAALQWNNPNPGGIFSGAEFWSIAFNCDQTKMMVGGTGGSAIQLTAAVYEINMNTGAVVASQDYVQGATFSIPPNVQEIRALCSSSNGKYYFLTQDTVGAFHQNFSLCNPTSSLLFKNTSSYNFGYKCENYRYDNSGICAIKANDQFFYTQNGTNVHKRSLANGSIIASAPIPGGGNTVSLGENAAHNSGIDIDVCGNVYVGSKSSVVKYDANLNQIATFPILFNVYDVLVTSGGELIVAGSTGNSSSANRTGYIQTIDVNACEPLTIICCDATICPVPNLCLTGNTIQLTAATPGGVWSGPGVSIGGIFNPAIAGVGTHTITYTLACGADSVTIIVSPCQSLEACIESNGTVTVSNGVAPYSWSYFQPASSTPITNQAQCVACGYTWFFGTCLNGIIPVTDCITPAQWITFATGNNASIPPTVTQFQVTDNASGSQLFTLSNLLPCTTCPTITVNNILQINCTCTGGSDGAITIEALGGNAPYTYLWNNGSTSSAISNLSAGQYSVTVTDADGCTGSLTVTITEPTNSPLPDVQFSIVNSTICLTDSTTGINQNIEPQTTYTWDIGYGPLLNTNTGVNIVAAQLGLGMHNITLTATGVCGTANSTVTLTVIDCTLPPPVADYAVSSNNICAGDCITITNLSLADPAAAYAWLFPNGIPAIANTFDPGIICFPNAGTSDVSLSVTNPDGQQSTLVTTVTINNCTLPPPVALFTINTNPICAGDCVGFNNTSTYAAGATFTWTFQGGVPATSNTLNPGLVCFTNSGTSSVKLVVTNPDGQTDSLTLTLTINNCVSTPVASFNTSNTNLCSGDCITIFNNSTASIGANYQWTFSGGSPASFNGAVPPTVCFTTSGNYVIELIITDAGGSDTANLTISVNDCNFPVALFDASSTNICIGDSILFTDQSTNATTWNWVFSGGTPAAFSGNNPPYITYNTAGSYIALLTVTDGAGHDSSYFVIINVSDCIYPSASLTGTGTHICTGACVQYNDNSQNATSWLWSFPGGVPSTSTDQNPPLICYPVAGIYPVTLIVSNTNGSDTLTINTGAIVHNPQPVNLLFSNYSLITGDSIQLVAGGGNSYQWIPATYLSSDSIPNPMASPPDTTIYTVIMTDQYGCTSSATVTVNVHPPFVVFVPNTFSPNGDGVNDQIQIYASVPLIELEFYIYDRWGTRVFTSYTYGEKWDGTFRGKPCNSGVYAYYYHARFADRSQISGHGDITLLK